MSKEYEMFKARTLEAETIVTKCEAMLVIDESFANGFHKAMWEAREIYMRQEDESTSLNPTEAGEK